jgi:enoyl-CoA hydratase/carnithine racemase
MTAQISDTEINAMLAALNLRHIEVRLVENIGEVYINNPPHNYLSLELMHDLRAVYDNFHTMQDDGRVDLRGIIITGKGRVFSSGASLDMLGSVMTPADRDHFRQIAEEAVLLARNYRVPVIAAINGICLGAGLELTLPCHYRICGKGVILGFPEIKLGFMPGGGGTQLLPKIIGRSKAAHMILSGRFVSAEEALAMGLVDMVVPRKEVMTAARTFAREICLQHPKATRHILQAMDDGMALNIFDGLELEQRLFWELVDDRIAAGGISNKDVGLHMFRKK